MGEAPVRRGIPVAGELTGGVHAVRLRQLAAAVERKRTRRAVYVADAIDGAVGCGGHVDEQSRRFQPDFQKVRMRLEYLHVLRIAHIAEDSVTWRPARPLRMELREPHNLVARPPPARRRAEAVMRSPRPLVRRRPERIGRWMCGAVRHARAQHVAPEGPRRAKAQIDKRRKPGRARCPHRAIGQCCKRHSDSQQYHLPSHNLYLRFIRNVFSDFAGNYITFTAMPQFPD